MDSEKQPNGVSEDGPETAQVNDPHSTDQEPPAGGPSEASGVTITLDDLLTQGPSEKAVEGARNTLMRFYGASDRLFPPGWSDTATANMRASLSQIARAQKEMQDTGIAEAAAKSVRAATHQLSDSYERMLFPGWSTTATANMQANFSQIARAQKGMMAPSAATAAIEAIQANVKPISAMYERMIFPVWSAAASANMQASLSHLANAQMHGLLPRPPKGFLDSVLTGLASNLGQISSYLDSDYFQQIITGLLPAIEELSPPNWTDLDTPDSALIAELSQAEGLPLAWTPPANILVRLLNADTAQMRRNILGDSWQPIARDCREQTEYLTEVYNSHLVEFAQQAVDALLAGHWQAAQALASNALDTAITEFFGDEKHVVVGQRRRPEIDELPFKKALITGGLWGSHSQFFPGDPVPRRYSRHASVHAVGKRQYSRLNALIAVMHLVALLQFGNESQ